MSDENTASALADECKREADEYALYAHNDVRKCRLAHDACFAAIDRLASLAAASAASLVAEPEPMREALESIATMVALLPDGSETITEAAILKRARRALGAA